MWGGRRKEVGLPDGQPAGAGKKTEVPESACEGTRRNRETRKLPGLLGFAGGQGAPSRQIVGLTLHRN